MLDPEEEPSEEPCEPDAAAVLPASCLQHLDSSDWKERFACLEALEKAVVAMDKSRVPCHALVRLLGREPGWKETKLQVMQKKLQVVALIAQKGNFSKASAQCVLGSLVDKIGDVICGSDTKEALTAVAEACGLPWTAGKVTEVAFSQDSPRTHSATLNWLAGAIEEFGFDGMEAGAFVRYMKSALDAAHPDVRESAFNLLGVMYLHVGAPLRTFFEDQTPPLLARIDAAFERAKGKGPPAPTRGRCQFCGEAENEPRGGDAQLCRKGGAVDLGKSVPAGTRLKLQDASWQVRREGLEELSGVLSGLKSIQPGLGDLATVLRSCLQDSNKALVKQTLLVLQQLARLMGLGIKHHLRTLGIPLMAVFKDSQSGLRGVARKTMEVWAEQAGTQEWMDGVVLPAELKKELPSQRQGILGWLAEKLPCPGSASADLLRCLPHLYSSLEDRHTREAAREAVPFFLLHLGPEKMSEAAAKLKPASREQVLSELEDAKAGWPPEAAGRSGKPLSGLPSGRPWPQLASSPPGDPAASPAENPGLAAPSLGAQRAKPEGPVPKARQTLGLKARHGLKEDGSHAGPLFLVIPKAKEQRAKDEKTLRALRWNFAAPSSRYVEQLKAQMSGCLDPGLLEELFHSNFQHHIKALTVMARRLEAEKDGVISCLDLVLKWLTLRLFDTNTWVLMKSLEYLRRLFDLLAQEDYQLSEHEAASFLPYLLLKMGATKESVLNEVRAILKQALLVYPVARVFGFLLEGARSKNPSQRAGCLEELAGLLREYGREVCQPGPAKALKALVVLSGDSNNAVHSAALRAIAAAREAFGAEAFKVTAGISEKHMSLLEEGIREEAARRVREEKPGVQGVFPQSGRAGAGEGGKRSPGAGGRAGEDPSAAHQERTEAAPASRQDPTRRASFEIQARSNVDVIICRVASGNVGTSTEALAEIREILRQGDERATLSGHVNQFLIAALRQLKLIHRLHVTSEEETKEGKVMELYGGVLCTMASVFQAEGLARETSSGVLKELIGTLITFLLDSPVEDLPARQGAAHPVHLLLIRVLETSEPARVLSSLLALLRESMTAPSGNLAFSEMAAKCLWKTAKLLPQTIGAVNLEQLLLDIHTFMQALPEKTLAGYLSNLPHRALRALLHSLCDLKGAAILDHLGLIPDREASELEAYLRKCVRSAAEQQGVGGDGERPLLADSPADHALAAIFKKINCKERAGLEELYEYKQGHPEADLEPFLKNRSLLFRSYVKHGLAVIGSERGGKQHSLS